MHAHRFGVFLLCLLVGCSAKPPYQGRSVAQLQKMLDDPSPNVQAQGALGLALHGAEAAPAVPALMRALQSTHALVRQQSAAALAAIGKPAEEAVPALTTALSDAEWPVRRQAALALGAIGPAARSAETALKVALRIPRRWSARQPAKRSTSSKRINRAARKPSPGEG